VADEDDAFDALGAGAESGDGPDVVGDRHERRPGQVGPICRRPLVGQVHLPEAAGDRAARQAEASVVAAVNVPDELVNLLVVTLSSISKTLYTGNLRLRGNKLDRFNFLQ